MNLDYYEYKAQLPNEQKKWIFGIIYIGYSSTKRSVLNSTNHCEFYFINTGDNGTKLIWSSQLNEELNFQKLSIFLTNFFASL